MLGAATTPTCTTACAPAASSRRPRRAATPHSTASPRSCPWWHSGLAFAALVGLFALTAAERVPVWPVLATAGAPHALVGHGRTRIALGDPEPGTALLELACHAQPDPYHCAETAMWLAELGRCAPAQAALAAATAASSQETGPDRGPEGALGAYLTEAATWVGRCGTDEPPPTP